MPFTRPGVVIICLEQHQLFTALYGHHLATLATRLEVCEATTPAQARRYLSSTVRPQAIIVADAFITNPVYRDILFQLVDYAWAGGTVIYAGVTGCFAHPVELDAAFQHAWGLPWRSSSFYQNMFYLNPAAACISTSPRHISQAYSMRVRFVSGVDLQDALYLEQSNMRRVETAEDGRLTYETPAAFAPVGHGYLGFIGDVDGEEGTVKLLIAMCLRPGARAPLTPGTGEPANPGTIHASVAHPVAGTRRREAQVVARASARDMNSRAKAAMALQLKVEGDLLFEAQSWGEAANKYRNAALLAGPQSVYLHDLSAALLKLQRWDALESAASRALLHSPDHVESLYRRAIALKEMRHFAAAEADLHRLLLLDESKQSAREELDCLRALERSNEDTYSPGNHDNTADLEEDSDSEDSTHMGSGVPCKFHNHDGCLHRTRCRFMHAPDTRSVRDDLGRNICLHWLVGECRYKDTCLYAHDGTYLPPNGWWTDTARLDRLRKEFYDAVELDPIEVSESISAEALRPRSWRQDLWAAPVDYADEHYCEARKEPLPDPPRPITRAHGTGNKAARASTTREHPTGPSGHRGPSGSSRFRSREDYEDWWEERIFERTMYCGHSEDDFNELLSQGIKPWDEF